MTHRKLITLIVFSLVLFIMPGLHVRAGVRQEKAAPFSKPELISLLRQSASRRLSQGDIIEQVEQRGISFAVDEAAINELKQAGARTFLIESIKRLGKTGGKSDDYPAGVADEAGSARVKADDLARLPLLEQTRHNVLENAKELPNFVVNQGVSRYSRIH